MNDTCPHGQPRLSAALNAKFPTACHAPLPTCPRCHGEGERWVAKREFVPEGYRPCLCVFVTHADVPLVADVIRTVVDKETNAPTRDTLLTVAFEHRLVDQAELVIEVFTDVPMHAQKWIAAHLDPHHLAAQSYGP